MSFVRSNVVLKAGISILVILSASTIVISQAQTSSTGRSAAAKTEGAIRFGLALPRVNLIGSGGNANSEASSLRKTVGSYLVGPKIGTVVLRARLDSMALEECLERQCDYVLYTSLTSKRRPGGTRASGASKGTLAGDEITFEYKLVSTDGTQPPTANVTTAKVKADGEDVLAPLIESAAQAIINIARQARPASAAGSAHTPASESANISEPVPPTTPAEAVPDSPPVDDPATASRRRPPASSRNDLPKAEGTIRIGMVLPRVTLIGGGAVASKESLALRETIGSYLGGSTIETIDLKARLDSLAWEECGKRECDYVLYTTLVRKRQNSGSRSGGSVENILGGLGGAGLGNKVPGGKTAQQVSKGAASMGGSVAAMAKAKDEVLFEYKLVAVGEQRAVIAKSAKAKVKSDGEDVLTPMIETAAQAIVDATKKN